MLVRLTVVCVIEVVFVVSLCVDVRLPVVTVMLLLRVIVVSVVVVVADDEVRVVDVKALGKNHLALPHD